MSCPFTGVRTMQLNTAAASLRVSNGKYGKCDTICPINPTLFASLTNVCTAASVAFGPSPSNAERISPKYLVQLSSSFVLDLSTRNRSSAAWHLFTISSGVRIFFPNIFACSAFNHETIAPRLGCFQTTPRNLRVRTTRERSTQTHERRRSTVDCRLSTIDDRRSTARVSSTACGGELPVATSRGAEALEMFSTSWRGHDWSMSPLPDDDERNKNSPTRHCDAPRR
mmetsp:Transcript_6202/g.21007  ORF Transcript_6202/g.21007 Transcript_6202/m.21007 type:complete len:226 (+) Transcript_6202:714-1391(+)